MIKLYKKGKFPDYNGGQPTNPRDLTHFRPKHAEKRAEQKALPHVSVTNFGAQVASRQSLIHLIGMDIVSRSIKITRRRLKTILKNWINFTRRIHPRLTLNLNKNCLDFGVHYRSTGQNIFNDNCIAFTLGRDAENEDFDLYSDFIKHYQVELYRFYNDFYINFICNEPFNRNIEEITVKNKYKKNGMINASVILSTTPRAGSTLLSILLSNISFFGGFTEHFNRLTTDVCKENIVGSQYFLDSVRSVAIILWFFLHKVNVSSL